MCAKFSVMLDGQRFTRKPTAKDAAAITTRFKTNHAAEVTPAQFFEAIRRGQTWVGGCFEPGTTDEKGKPIWGAFISQQIFACDFDNSAFVYDANGNKVKDADGRELKRPLMSHEAGFITVEGALNRCASLDLQPLCWYATMSAKPDWRKFRLVFDIGEPITDELHAKAIIEQFRFLFTESDQAITKPNRLFYGSNGELHDLARGAL